MELKVVNDSLDCPTYIYLYLTPVNWIQPYLIIIIRLSRWVWFKSLYRDGNYIEYGTCFSTNLLFYNNLLCTRHTLLHVSWNTPSNYNNIKLCTWYTHNYTPVLIQSSSITVKLQYSKVTNIIYIPFCLKSLIKSYFLYLVFS